MCLHDIQSKKVHSKLSPSYIHGSIPEKVQSHTHLEMTFNLRMTWQDQIKCITTKVSRGLNEMKKIKHLIPRSILEKLYLTLVQSVIEFGKKVYDANE